MNKCNKCGYDYSGSGDSAHVCGPVKIQQRTWVGLTDEERMELYSKFTDSDEWTYEKAIEAKLKEKNT
jgi:hypothetical protein